ncbi:hypothetical protein UJ101_01752 [Flavobacteriaceae bacterium UJ101]|nr:hypothetical protein UJ101_01752 [Flavobacteriaceae bacterium UJ101]
MKKATTIISILLGIILIVFGLNKFLNFMPPMELATSGMEFMGALIKTGYMMTIVALVEIITGILIVINKYRALALVILFPVLLNALLFHVFLDPVNALPAVFAVAMNIFLMYTSKDRYQELFKA